MVTARHNTEARRIVYYEGGLYGPFSFYRWAVTPSGERLPIYVYPLITEGEDYNVQSVRLVDTPLLPDELPNLGLGQHKFFLQRSTDGVLWVPIYQDFLAVVTATVYEPD